MQPSNQKGDVDIFVLLDVQRRSVGVLKDFLTSDKKKKIEFLLLAVQKRLAKVLKDFDEKDKTKMTRNQATGVYLTGLRVQIF